MKKNIVKKGLGVILVGLMVSAVSGCGIRTITPSGGEGEQMVSESVTDIKIPEKELTEEASSEETLTEDMEPHAPTCTITDITFEVKWDNDEYGVITAYDADGNEIWAKATDTHPAAQLYSVGGIGLWENIYYYSEEGAVVALNASDGSELWRNTDFGGYRAGDGKDCFIDSDGYAYVAGGFGPDLFVVAPDGTTIYRLEDCGAGILFPSIELVDNQVKISGYDSTADDGEYKEYFVDISSFK